MKVKKYTEKVSNNAFQAIHQLVLERASINDVTQPWKFYDPHLLTYYSGADGIKERPGIQKKYLRSKFFDKFQYVRILITVIGSFNGPMCQTKYRNHLITRNGVYVLVPKP